ncbi:MAG TPA: isochorismatase family cysteine hydrolase [Nocardioidaceae bacterium]|nr:isochorismatase family cysteine hydrolase [Nocardioidaceae bacterium]
MTSALIVVDMQNAFIRPTGALAVPDAATVVDAVNEHIVSANEAGRPIFYTRDVAPTQLPQGDPDRQTALHDDLLVRGTVVDKGPGKHGGFSGFVLSNAHSAGPGTGGLSDLAEHLRTADVDEVAVVGLAADVCVAATARDARRLGYRATIPLEATAFVHAHPGGDDAALTDLAAAGVSVGQGAHHAY